MSTYLLERGYLMSSSGKRSSLASLLLTECLCAASFEPSQRTFTTRGDNEDDENASLSFSAQLIILGGIECISLGSVAGELPVKNRVMETISNNLITQIERHTYVGYLNYPDIKDKGEQEDDRRTEIMSNISSNRASDEGEQEQMLRGKLTDVETNNEKSVHSISLEGLSSRQLGTFAEKQDLEKILPAELVLILTDLKNEAFESALKKMSTIMLRQENGVEQEPEKDLLGLTYHNIAVLYLLQGQLDEAVEFSEKAIETKTNSFGENHHLVADSLNEIGVQYFAKGEFEESLSCLKNANAIRVKSLGSHHPKSAMTLNNIGCAHFMLRDTKKALSTFEEAKQLLHNAVGSSLTVGTDLINVATIFCNIGYLYFRLNKYDEARSIFEEALLLQQSVLGDEHRIVQDTQNNIAFTNTIGS